MKIYISADIEGISTTTRWEDTRSAEADYPFHAKQMTREVLAAIEGATEAGATEIVVKDAHGKGANIDITCLPRHVKVIRNWEGHPYMMVQGIDSSFDAVMFVGYHCAAGGIGNPMSHSMTRRTQKVTVNDMPLSEFLLYSWCAANEGVPAVFLSGDEMICRQGNEVYPWLTTAAVKEGIGSSTFSVAPDLAVDMIREGARKALEQDLSACQPQIPEHFSVRLTYKEHTDATAMSYFPGAFKVDSHTVGLEEDDVFELARKLKFMF